MVHVGRSPIPLGKILDALRPGDIVTHPFHGSPNGPLDDKGKLRREVIEAQERGIILDSGCAKVHMDLNVCRIFLDQAILPDTISSDGVRLDRSYSLPQVMSIFLGLGMSLEQIVAQHHIGQPGRSAKNEIWAACASAPPAMLQC